jgi:excisionase family DNA binding protein
MYLTIAQVAERLQVSSKTVMRRIKDGSLKACKITPQTIRIDERDLQAYMDQHKTA